MTNEFSFWQFAVVSLPVYLTVRYMVLRKKEASKKQAWSLGLLLIYAAVFGWAKAALGLKATFDEIAYGLNFAIACFLTMRDVWRTRV